MEKPVLSNCNTLTLSQGRLKNTNKLPFRAFVLNSVCANTAKLPSSSVLLPDKFILTKILKNKIKIFYFLI
jgi:hypothetical protein